MMRMIRSNSILLFLVLLLAGALAMAGKSQRTDAPSSTSPDLSRGPSLVIYPPQSIPIRFDHKKHVQEFGASCVSCHPAAKTSKSVHDVILPGGTACDTCHGTSHANLSAVTGSTTGIAACATCHENYDPAIPNRVARVILPDANLVFSHKAHATRNIGCPQCHGDVSQLGVATRNQLPTMQTCIKCHMLGDAPVEARGDAKGTCDTCHVGGTGKAGGRLQTLFSTGKLMPPRWLHDAAHDSGFMQRHKFVAGNDSQFCAQCHKEEFCTECHDGRVRPRNIHPNDYLSMHATEARLATQNCTSCHREQSFCLQCHQRLGVSMSGPASVRESGRFHPPKAVWSDMPRRSGHHAFEATRNLNACVSCHIERDCVVCHGGAGIGAGFNPHGGGFVARCGALLRRNARPCLVCHEPDSREIAQCR